MTEEPLNREALMDEVDVLARSMRQLLVRCKNLPKQDEKLETYQMQKRSLTIAQEHLQTGFLWLRRCVSGDTRF